MLERIPPPKVKVIDVAGRTVDQVARLITARLPQDKGCVVVLQGMSGTGKSTTTKRLLSLLPRSAGWSNGNVFRSLTLLAATHCEQRQVVLKERADEVLTPDNIAAWVGMLSFEATGSGYTIRIKGLGHDVTVDDVATTLLQEPRVARNIPTVAEKTQGEVIKFAAAALERMAKDGKNVVLEGRAPTVQYVPTPYRYELVLRDTDLLGRRRAAQRCIGMLQKCFAGGPPPTEAAMLREAAVFCAKESGQFREVSVTKQGGKVGVSMRGAVIAAAVSGGAAEAAGLRAGMEVVGIDGAPVLAHDAAARLAGAPDTFKVSVIKG